MLSGELKVGRISSPGIEVLSNQVLVADPGSYLESTGNIYVGDNWDEGESTSTDQFSRLTVSNGSTVIGANLYVGAHAISSNNSVVVIGPQTLLNVHQDIIVGATGTWNALSVLDRATITATNMIIGQYTNSTGNLVSISGGSLLLTNSVAGAALDIRRGTLALNSGTVTVNKLYATNDASSIVNFNGGTLNTGGSTISNGVTFTIGNGIDPATLNLTGGTHYFANGVSLSTNSFLTGTGTMFGSVTNFGSIAPGNSPGTIIINGDLTLADSSELDMQIGGIDPELYDRLLISGGFSVAGKLNVTLINGYIPANGSTFDLFNYGSETGTFAQISLPVVLSQSDWNTNHLYAPASDPLSGSITFIPEPSTWVLLGAGLGFGAVWRLRRKKK